MSERNDPKGEGHTREWQDRARVVLDAKKDADSEASPNQSPEGEKAKGKESGSDERKNDEPAY